MILDSPNPVLLEIIDEIFYSGERWHRITVHNNRQDKEDIDKTHIV